MNMTNASLNMFMMIFSFITCFIFFTGGFLVGRWHQKRESDKETRLLIEIWERIYDMRSDIDDLKSSAKKESTEDDRFTPIETQILDLDATQIIDTNKYG